MRFCVTLWSTMFYNWRSTCSFSLWIFDPFEEYPYSVCSASAKSLRWINSEDTSIYLVGGFGSDVSYGFEDEILDGFSKMSLFCTLIDPGFDFLRTKMAT
ncbi:hypothetical protein U1Q18_043579 [Sarracenia purpurea var. burkii]